MKENFAEILFKDAPESLRLQAIKTNSAYKLLCEKEALLKELSELTLLVTKQIDLAYVEFKREERIYRKEINGQEENKFSTLQDFKEYIDEKVKI